MRQLDGIFDNLNIMERESWTKGRLMGHWPERGAETLRRRWHLGNAIWL